MSVVHRKRLAILSGIGETRYPEARTVAFRALSISLHGSSHKYLQSMNYDVASLLRESVAENVSSKGARQILCDDARGR